jgi:hypothetical protein
MSACYATPGSERRRWAGRAVRRQNPIRMEIGNMRGIVRVKMEETFVLELLSDYKRSYYDAVAGIQQGQVASMVSALVLADFPSKLPADVRNQIIKAMKDFAAMLNDAPQEQGSQEKTSGGLHTGGFPFMWPSLKLFISNVFSKGSPQLDFGPLLFQQALVMTLAHIDGFLSESFKVIFRREPRVLRRSKQLTWEDALAAGSYDNLLTTLSEQYAFELGWKTLSQRIEWMRDEINLPLPAVSEYAMLEEAFQIRHIIVHNGGRVSKEFLVRTSRADVTLGEALVLTPGYCEEVAAQAELFCADVFVSIAKKFLGAKKTDLTGIFMRKGKLDGTT